MPYALIAVALAAVGTGVSAYAAVAQGQAAEDAGKFNAAVAANDATNAQNQANFEATQIRRRNAIRGGSDRAAFAKGGVDISGSAQDVLFDNAIQGELDVMAAQYGGAARAQYYTSKGALAKFEGRQAASAGVLNAGSTILTGASRAASYGKN